MKSYEEYYTEFMNSLFNRQKSSSVKNSTIKSGSKWKVFFIFLLIINGIFISYIGIGAAISRSLGVGVIGLLIYGLPLLFIDFIAVLVYVIKRKPHGILKFISIIAFAILCFMLTIFVIGVIIIINPNLFMN